MSRLTGWARRARREEGVVIPMVALLLVVIVGVAAFAIDLSGWYFDQRHLQMQADAGVLAGANTFVKGLSSCDANKTQVATVTSQYAGQGSGGISSNNEQGTVTGTPTVQCSGTGGAYVDLTLTNSNPPSFFSNIFGIHPSISAHARASLLQVTEEGGSTVLPYAIQQSQAVFNNQLTHIIVNDGSGASQSLACDGTTPGTNYGNLSGTTGGVLMQSLEGSGCPLTQVNTGGSSCPATTLSPPSCLWEFSKVSESDYDKGEVPRFENGTPMGGGQKCTNPYPIPTNNYAQYLSNGTLVTGDPRIITIFVVPNGSFSTSGGLIPIVGYAQFYAVGWDHDPCAGSSDPDPPNKEAKVGSIWGYFISYVNPESSNLVGSGPCNPNPSYAYTYNCTYALTQ